MKKVLVFSLVLSLALFGCKKKQEEPSDTNNTPTGVNNTPNETRSEFYFTANFDGTNISYEHNKNNYANFTGGGGASDSWGYYMDPNTGFINYFDQTAPHVVVSIGKVYPLEPTLDITKTIISAKSFPYGKTPRGSETPIDGAVIKYYDDNGTEWATDKGDADQSASSFQVTEYIDAVDPNTSPYKIMTVQFSCILYDGNGNSKVVTNGEIRGETVTY